MLSRAPDPLSHALCSSEAAKFYSGKKVSTCLGHSGGREGDITFGKLSRIFEVKEIGLKGTVDFEEKYCICLQIVGGNEAYTNLSELDKVFET